MLCRIVYQSTGKKKERVEELGFQEIFDGKEAVDVIAE
jgi:hypothetical protein